MVSPDVSLPLQPHHRRVLDVVSPVMTSRSQIIGTTISPVEKQSPVERNEEPPTSLFQTLKNRPTLHGGTIIEINETTKLRYFIFSKHCIKKSSSNVIKSHSKYLINSDDYNCLLLNAFVSPVLEPPPSVNVAIFPHHLPDEPFQHPNANAPQSAVFVRELVAWLVVQITFAVAQEVQFLFRRCRIVAVARHLQLQRNLALVRRLIVKLKLYYSVKARPRIRIALNQLLENVIQLHRLQLLRQWHV